MTIKSKILAILSSDCDNEIKSELIEELVANQAMKYHAWALSRTSALVSSIANIKTNKVSVTDSWKSFESSKTINENY